MPTGAYPGRVKAFRKWSQDRIDKADINNSVTASGKSTSSVRARRKRRKKRKKRAKNF